MEIPPAELRFPSYGVPRSLCVDGELRRSAGVVLRLLKGEMEKQLLLEAP